MPAAGWRLLAEAMEPRILHSADLAPLLWSGDAALHASATATTTVPASATVTRTEIVFVDAGVPDAQSLIADLQAQRDAGRPIEIVTIGATDDGLALIGDTLAARHDISAVHVLAHGSAGQLQLGSSRLDGATLLQRAGAIAGWSQALTEDADLLLYGCDLAQSAAGQQLVQGLAALTGADVAASTDLTGAAAAGGDWVLEYTTGGIETAVAPTLFAQARWGGVLATYTVTNTADFAGAANVAGTLRWAISQANAHAGTDTIVFAIDGRIDLAAGNGDDNNSGGDFDITGSVRIQGNGSTRTVINGAGLDRVFDVRGGTVSLSGLTVQGGASNSGAGIRVTANADLDLSDAVVQGNVGKGGSKGGGIYNAGTLTLLRTLVQNNGDTSSGDVDGAGIYNASGATLTARDVEIRGNVATSDKDGGGLYVEDKSSAVLENVTLADNQAKRGGGLWSSGTVSAVNVTVSGNTATSQGGGLWFDKGTLSLNHATVASNSSATGGGVFQHDNANDIVVTDSLFAANTGANSNRDVSSAGYNLSDDDSMGLDATGDRSNATSSAIALGGLADNGGFGRTMAIGSTSVARNAANPLTLLGADQRGTPYVLRADIGAYEYSILGLAPTISTIAGQTLAEDTPATPIAFSVADAQTAESSLIVTATSSNAALLPSASLVLGGSGGARTLGFTPLANASGTTTITVTVSDGLLSTSTSFVLTVQPVNDAPLLSLPAAQAVNEDGVLSFSGLAAPSISDVDAGGASLQMSLSVAHGRLTLAQTAGLSFVVGTGSDNTSLVFSGSQSAINAALASLQYRPGSDYSGADQLDLSVSDFGNTGSGGARTASGSVAITVNAVNDAPTLSLPGTQSTPLLTPLPFADAVGNAIRLADVDSGATSLRLTLTTANLAGGGTLSFGSLAGLTLVSGSGTLDSTVVLLGSAANLNAALQTLSFSAGSASLSRLDVSVDDLGGTGLGGARQASGSINIAIGADAVPVLTLGTPAATFTEGSAPLVLVPGLTLSDADHATLAAAQWRISSGYASAQDELRFANDGLTMGNIVASYSAGTLSLSSAGQTATLAQWQAALRSVTYANASDAPSTATRGFALSVNDGIADSAARQWTLGVTAVNDAPTLGGANDFAAITEDLTGHAGMLVSALIAGHVGDADDAAMAGVAVIGVDDAHGSWQYTRDGGASWQAIGPVSDGSSRLLAADAATAVRFVPAADWNGSVANGLRLRAWDQTSGSAGALADTRGNGGSSAFSSASFASSLTVTPVNDAPQSAAAIADQSAIQHAAFAFTVPAGRFSDIDIGDTLTYSAALAGGAALPAWLHFDAATRSFSGTPGEVDVATLTIRVTATDAAGASAASDFQLTVIDLNDEPVLVGSVADQAATEDLPFVFALPAGLFTDINVGDTLSYSLTLASGAPLPAWLAFDAATQTLSGTPGNGDVGLLSLRLTATDHDDADAHVDFALSVANANDAPQLTAPLAAQSASQGSAFAFTLPAGAFSDIDAGDTLALTARLGSGAVLPAWLHFDAATATFSGTPANGDVDAITINVTATDAGGATAAGNFTLTVANVNDAPVAGVIAAQTAMQDQSFSFTLPAGVFTDIDAGDSLSLTARLGSGAALPAWLHFNAATATFSGTPANGDVGDLTVNVTATDASSATASSNFTLTVANVNDAPVASVIAAQTATQGQSFGFTLPAGVFTEVDAGDSLALTARLGSGATLPGWLHFDATTATFSGTPANDDVDAITVNVTATDGSGATATGRFTLTVANENDAPVAGAIAAQMAMQDQAFSFTLPPGTFTDIDAGDSLALTARLGSGAALPAWLHFDAATATFSGTPANGDVGALTVNVTATDASGATAASSFTLTVANVNDAPVAGLIAAQAAAQDQAFSFTLPPGTFTDIDAGDSLTLTARLGSGAALPAWLHFDVATATFSGTPANGDVGAITVNVMATDTSGATAASAFTLTVTNVNDAPAAGAITAQTATQGQAFSLTLPAGLFTDIDVGDTLALIARLDSGAALPAWLHFDATSGSFTGTPSNADVGSLRVTVTATDAGGASVGSSFALTVANVNDAPVLAGPIATQAATQGQGFAFKLPAGLFTDVDASDTLALTASLASGAALPAWLRFDAATQTFSGTPVNDDVGSLALQVTATDASGATARGSFTLTVANVNDAPVAAGSIAAQNATEDQAFSFTLPVNLFTDIDTGDTLALSARLGSGAALPAWLHFDPTTRTFSGTPANADVGALNLQVTATDAGGASASTAFALTVRNVNDAPTLALPMPAQSALASSSVQWALPPATFDDADAGDVLAYAATLADGSALPAWLSFDAQHQIFTAQPALADAGELLVRVTASDAAGASAQTVFAVVVVEPAPVVAPAPAPVAPAPVAAPATPVAEQTKALTEAPAPLAAAPVVLAVGTPPAAGLDTRLVIDTTVAPADTRRAAASSDAPTSAARLASRSDAVLATALLPQYGDLSAASLTQLLRSDDLLRRLDDLQRQMAEPGAEHRQVMASSIAITSGLSIGYVVWLVRGGVLVSSMLSALPAWQMIDPLPVLAAASAAKQRRGDRAAREADPDVESLFDDRRSRTPEPTE